MIKLEIQSNAAFSDASASLTCQFLLTGISPMVMMMLVKVMMVMMMLVKAVTLMVIRTDLMLMDDNRKTANADQTVKGNVGENQGKSGS